MTKLQESEFKAIKKHLKIASVPSTARTMNRSKATIHRIKGSNDYNAYVSLVQAEHSPNKPRVPLNVRIHKARVEELMAIKARGKIASYIAVCQRLEELLQAR